EHADGFRRRATGAPARAERGKGAPRAKAWGVRGGEAPGSELESGFRSVSHQTIIVLDFGSQYTQLIARRLRELSVYSEVWRPDTPVEAIRERRPAGIILSGGPKSVAAPGAPHCDARVYELGLPVLGICYGMQLMAHALGGRVAPAPQREFGHARVSITARREAGADAAARGAQAAVAVADPAALFVDVPDEIRVWASHGDLVAAAPDGFSVVA